MDFAALRDTPQRFGKFQLQLVDRRTARASRVVRRLVQSARSADALLLNGSGRLDQVAAALIARRSSIPIVISECTWGRGDGALDRLACQLGAWATDGARVDFCVLSSEEVTTFRSTWPISNGNVRFTPYCFTLTADELAVETRDDGGVFAGGDSYRDYDVLLAAARAVSEPMILATRQVDVARAPHNVRARPVAHPEFVDLLRRAKVVVVPLRGDTERSAGQQTYLNAMALGKLVIATAAPGVRDYIEDGKTGLIVPAGNVDALVSVLRWSLAPSNSEAIDEIRVAARTRALTRFTPQLYLRTLLQLVSRATG